MARLTLSLLGTFEAALAGEPVATFEYDKVRALLAFLAVEADRSHRREALAGLLWPERPERQARQSLSQALFSLRRAIGDTAAVPPFFLITPQTLQFNTASNYQLDVTTFSRLASRQSHAHDPPAAGAAHIARLQQAVELYRGNFLAGFSVSDSPAFEEWMVLTRERLQRLAIEALGHLAAHFEQRSQFEQALYYARRQVELEPWREETHRQVMRLLALSGQRGAALAQYETCRRLLLNEFELEPEAETTALFQQIKAGRLSQPAEMQASQDRTFSPLPQPPAPVVARHRQLTQLKQFMDSALAGQGQIVFVTGGPGRGKTALLREFARRAQLDDPRLIVVGGKGHAHTGVGDPYLLFCEILEQLTGDAEALWAIGEIAPEHAGRLWNLLPLIVQLLLDMGPDLIDTFLPGEALEKRAALALDPGAGNELARLKHHLERLDASREVMPRPQSDLFEQYTRLLRVLAEHYPLLLLLDDLQWADQGSVNLLFHLGRRLKGSRLLIVGAYRPAEVAIGYAGQRHPLEPVVNELRRLFGQVELDLSQADGRQFVDELLDTESNRLGNEFRQTLFRQTGGHPLFTVELLRGMQERGDLVQDPAGCWAEGPALDWETLPARVEAVIAERMDRLPENLRQLLDIAAAEGEIFTAEVIAQVQGVAAPEMVHLLSEKLERIHRLIMARGARQRNGQYLSTYRFRHFLFQKYLYQQLDPPEQVYLHQAVGLALERLYGEAAGEVAVQLAWHFEKAGSFDKAIDYLSQAGNRAVRLSANEEAMAHFKRALTLLETLPDTPERAQREIKLQLALAVPYLAAKGYGAPEVGRAYDRAWELCRQLGQTPQLFPVLWSLAVFYGGRADYQTSLEIATELLQIAEQAGDSLQMALAQWVMGWRLFFGGDFSATKCHLEQTIAFYDPGQHQALAFLYGQDFGVGARSVLTWALWLLGYPNQARRHSREAITLAQQIAHPVSLAFAQIYAATLYTFCRDNQTAQAWAEAGIDLSTQHRILYWLSGGFFCRGWALVEQGQAETGLDNIRRSLTSNLETGTNTCQTFQLAGLAEAYAKTDRIKEGLEAVNKALAVAHSTGEHFYEAEIHRLNGELLLRQAKPGAETQAENCFFEAIDIARRQQAKSLELRATMSLARLWQRQGKREKARQMLARIYGWFTEGFDTADLQEAQQLLAALSAP